MNRNPFRASSRNALRRFLLLALVGAVFVSLWLFSGRVTDAQNGSNPAPDVNGFRIGEKLTFDVELERFRDSMTAELYTVSRGRFGDKEAIELRAKFRTRDVASAAFYLIDQTRTTYVSPTTRLPLYTSVTENSSGLPKEIVQNFMSVPTPHTDLLTMLYWVRQARGSGSVTMIDNEKVYEVSYQPLEVEKLRTDDGYMETTVVVVQSDYFAELGISAIRVNLTNDDARLPMLVRFKTPKGKVRARLTTVEIVEPEVVVVATPTPTPVVQPERTPRPVATPTPYVDNHPLSSELAFDLGERLQYRVMSNGSQVADAVIAAPERRQIDGLDTLVLEASFSNVRNGSPFSAGDRVRVLVNPETLAPRQLEMRFGGALRAFSSSAKFEQQGSAIVYDGKNRIEAPVGTHTILSLLYAARSFNLKPSRDLNNPVNDTRVAVFWQSQAYVFTLRPSPYETLTIAGKPVSAQMITVNTGNPQLDQLNIRFWLGNDESRTPLRFVAGTFQFDLVVP